MVAQTGVHARSDVDVPPQRRGEPLTGDTSPEGADPSPPVRSTPSRAHGRLLSAVQVVALFLVVTLIPLATLTYATIHSSTRAVGNEVRGRVLAAATLEARAVSVRMQGVRELVASYAQRRTVTVGLGAGDPRRRDLASLQLVVDQLAASDPGFALGAVLDPAGREIAISPKSPATVGTDFSYRDWYQGVVRTGTTYVSTAYQTAAAGHPLVVDVAATVRAVPAVGEGPRVIGYVLVGYRLDAIQAFVTSFEVGQRLGLTLTDQAGTLLAAPGVRTGLVSAASDPAVRQALIGRSGTTTTRLRGARQVSGYASVAGVGWAVRADVPSSTAMPSVRHLARSIGLLAAGLAAVLVVAGLLFGRIWRARVRSETRERQAALYARSLLEASLDPLVTISPEGRITDANEAASIVTGVARHLLVGSDFAQYFTDPAKANDGYRKVFNEGSVADYDLTIRHTDGHLVDVVYNAALFRDGDGRVAGVFAAARDVTDRKRAEADLALRARQLEESNIELGRSNDELEQFAYVASHDLSEPLRAISGPVSLIKRRYTGQLDEEADEYIDFAVDGCQRMQQIIDDLLVYSRVGRIEEGLSPIDTNAVVERVLSILGQVIEESGAIVEVGSLPAVRAVPTQLSQVFQNLLSNALKFVQPGQVPRIIVRAERVAHGWRFTVTDNGIGIDPSHRERIFGMFKRLHGRTEYPGTGIGLALVKKVVERHGGRVGVEDNPDQAGSRFWFTLPAEEPP